MKRKRVFMMVRSISFHLLIIGLLAGCIPAWPRESFSTPVPLARELVLYDWDEDMPQTVLDAFTQEYGVKVRYLTYESQEAAMENMKAGEAYDVVVMESRFVPSLAEAGWLAELNKNNLPNLKNISANFRELAYDPAGRFSVPYSWGTTGLVVRSDLVARPVTRWADLWDPQYTGCVGIWMGQPREVISLTLKSLGYSANSENRIELEEALERLLLLKPGLRTLEEFDSYSSVDILSAGEIVVAMGYASDAMLGHELNPAIQYVLPQEGALLWNDTFVIPANSPNQNTAEVFLNFLLRPDIGASIVNENLYASPNEAASPFIDADILANRIIYPANEELTQAELILPLTSDGQRLYDEVWERFVTAP